MAVFYPWRSTSAAIPQLGTVYRYERTCPYIPPKSYSEADVHNASWTNRNLEVMPPVCVNTYPVGAWTISLLRMLYQLQRVPIASIVGTEAPYEMLWLKYVDWLRQGNEPPPIHLIERRDHTLAVSDGHHRVAAYKHLGRETILAWVNPLADDGWDLTHDKIVVKALKAGLGVPRRVAAEYGYGQNLRVTATWPVVSRVGEHVV